MYPGRRSIRLKDYDYAQEGAYCVTICTQHRTCLFGMVNGDGDMELDVIGQVVVDCWQAIPNHFPQVELDAFVVMPNHLHGILIINQGTGVGVGATHVSPLREPRGPNKGSLGAIVGSFKSAVTKSVREFPEISIVTIWQRNYYEQIIRDERMLNALREYLEANPANWLFDENNPSRLQ